MTQVNSLPLSALKVDPANVRKHSDVAIDEMVAMIRARGIIQSLRVRPNHDGSFMVTAGGRRFAALKKMEKAGEIAGDYIVPVIAGEEGDDEAREISLMENVGRVAMTPVEEFRAFAAVRDAGASVEDIALRFGCGEKKVRQRLALAALDKSILAALDKGEIGLDVAQAFTVTSDGKKQRAVYKQFAERGWFQPGNIVRALTEAKLPADAPLAQLVGEEAYLAAGGTVTEDLFAEGRYWDDAALALQLARDKHQKKAAKLAAEGWSWVAFADELPEEMGSPWQWKFVGGDGYRNKKDFTEKERAVSGVVIAVDTGEANYGVLKPGDAKRLAGERKAAAKAEAKAAGGETPADEPKGLPAALLSDLTGAANAALMHAVADDHDLALSILLAKLGDQYQASGLKVRFEGSYTEEDNEDFPARLARIRKMKPERRLAMLANHIASALDTRTHDPVDDPDRQAMFDAAKPDVAKHVAIDAATYFDRVPKARIYAALSDVENDQYAEGRYNGLKKGELVEAAVRIVTPTRWLPPELRCASYDGPALGATGRRRRQAS